jgi:choline dehydrogenase-like flavoprotein
VAAIPTSDRHFDSIIIGSGIGGAFAAHALLHAGERVLVIERGEWVHRSPRSWDPEGVWELTSSYCTDQPYEVWNGNGHMEESGGFHCVGGMNVFSGGVALRFRERDFDPAPEIVGDSGAEWPYSYADLEPYYSAAEQLLGVAGSAGEDPTEPRRSIGYPQSPAPLSRLSGKFAQAARELGLNPFRLPLAINYGVDGSRESCIGCETCDAYACAISAKNDVAVAIYPDLIEKGLELRTGTVAARITYEKGRATGVEVVDTRTGERETIRARKVLLAAGALGSPHLLLSSGIDALSAGGSVIGRYLLRHCNAMTFGFYPGRPNRLNEFHKQIAIHDLYFGGSDLPEAPAGKLGCLQQVMPPPVGSLRKRLGRPLTRVLSPFRQFMTGMLSIAEDQPNPANRLTIDRGRSDRYGLPRARIDHSYSARDVAARDALVSTARELLRRTGARIFYTHNISTFSHAVGTVRAGRDPATSALDEFCRVRGLENLYVVDGSYMPTAAAVNPSLTIAANALRTAERAASDSR